MKLNIKFFEILFFLLLNILYVTVLKELLHTFLQNNFWIIRFHENEKKRKQFSFCKQRKSQSSHKNK